jgi:hypothetical protein
MSSKVNIKIPKPCHENWEEMSIVDKGNFCNSCKKTVFDFTKATDKEIIYHLNKEKNICGRLLSTQLNRNLIETNKKSSYWSIVFTSAISIIGLDSQNAISQTKQDTIQTDNKNVIVNDTNPNLPHKIKGVIEDPNGPLAGANVVIDGTTNGTTTDFYGNFELNNIRLGDLLIVTYTGMKNESIVVGIKNNYKIYLTESTNNQEILVVGGYLIKRNFFGRQIHKIRNWFR